MARNFNVNDEVYLIDNYVIEITEDDIKKINDYIYNYKNKNVESLKFTYEEKYFSNNHKIGSLEINYTFSEEEIKNLLDEYEEMDENYILEITCDIRDIILSNIEQDIDDLIKFTNREFKAIKEGK